MLGTGQSMDNIVHGVDRKRT